VAGRYTLIRAPELEATDGPKHDPRAIVISAEAVSQTGYGTLAVWARSRAASSEVVIPSSDCGEFRF
jgi:hypothetical protein